MNSPELQTLASTDAGSAAASDQVLDLLPERWKSALLSQATDLQSDLLKMIHLAEGFARLGLNASVLSTGAESPLSKYSAQSYRREGYSTCQIKNRSENGALQEVGTIQFAPLFNGSYLIRKTLLVNKQVVTTTDQYDENGAYVGRYHDPSPNLLYVNLTDMDPGCPVLSHLYNILIYEYQQAETGQANSPRIRLIESIVRAADQAGDIPLSYRAKPYDEAVQRMNQRIVDNELDPALTFSDKGAVRKNLKQERASIIRVKKRVHGASAYRLRLKLIRADLRARAVGFAKRPQEKVLGTLHKYTIGIVTWFFGIVRNNIGYSVALAIYAPFTYYFITQPMNPGAMWAVGEIRKAFIVTTGFIQSIPVIGDLADGEDDNSKLVVDTKSLPSYDPTTPYSKVKPKFDGFLISTDVPDVEKQSWSERMSNFKQMQIAYESNLQFSQRMGRLEQMENQLNFPLIAEAAYRELEISQQRLSDLQAALQTRQKMTPEAERYLKNETLRTRQLKLYLWDKTVRYMLDHPYIVLNEAKDQAFVDYYIGRNFIFLEEITKDLEREYQGFRKPKGFDAIEKLAKFYRQKKVEANTPEERLEKNHFLYKQDGFYNDAQVRQNLKRQWEILFLSYNRTQEASNFGLQLYFWSVRNAMWAISALVTAKNRELELLVRDIEKGTGDLGGRYAHEKDRIESLYESLFHILSLEYVSIREELNRKLDLDIDSTQRQAVIESLKASFAERTAFLRSLK